MSDFKLKFTAIKLFTFFELIKLFWILKIRETKKFIGLKESYIILIKILNENETKVIKTNQDNLLLIHNNFLNFKVLVRKNSSDLRVYEQVIMKNEYGNLIKIIQKYQSKINTIIDGGSNIGLASLYFNYFFNNPKIISIEPANNNFSLLTKNIQINNLSNVHLLKAAIWKEHALLKISQEPNIREWAYKVGKTSNNALAELKGFSIENLMLKYNIETLDLLKLDVEGSESHIFDNSVSLKKVLSKTKFLAVEIHDYSEVEKIETYLKENNFTIKYSGEYTIGVNKSYNNSKTLTT